MSINNCQCPLAKVLQYVNSVVMSYGYNYIELNQFKDVLNTPSAIGHVNRCLTKHGFTGYIDSIDNVLAYHANT